MFHPIFSRFLMAFFAIFLASDITFAQGLGRIIPGGGNIPQITPPRVNQPPISRPQHQSVPQIVPQIQQGKIQSNIGQTLQGRSGGQGNNLVPNIHIGSGGNRVGGVLNSVTNSNLTQKRVIPDFKNVKPSTLLQNGGLINAQSQNNFGLGKQKQGNNHSPQHWNNWGQSWMNGNVSTQHRNWYNGSWNGFYGPGWYSGYNGYNGYGYGYGQGLAGGWIGINPWTIHSAGYRWGYQNYSNPYYNAGASGPYNYAQPVSVSYTQDQVVANDGSNGVQDFDAARTRFRSADYEQALSLIDNYIKNNPNDPVAHEFRALTLFALGRYEPAAATLDSLLAVAPGWNWATMSSFYASADTYTQQLRALEKFTVSNPDQAAARFTLAYHYLVTGHPEAAQPELTKVVQLVPQAQVARQLLQGLAKTDVVEKPTAPPPTPPAPEAVTELSGSWTAARDAGEQFQLSLTKEGDFIWTAGKGDSARKMSGRYNIEGNVLMLRGGEENFLAATITAENKDQFNFKLLGAPPEDSGLTFKRS